MNFGDLDGCGVKIIELFEIENPTRVVFPVTCIQETEACDNVEIDNSKTGLFKFKARATLYDDSTIETSEFSGRINCSPSGISIKAPIFP